LSLILSRVFILIFLHLHQSISNSYERRFREKNLETHAAVIVIFSLDGALAHIPPLLTDLPNAESALKIPGLFALGLDWQAGLSKQFTYHFCLLFHCWGKILHAS
jgi:hypothetical protein